MHLSGAHARGPRLALAAGAQERHLRALSVVVRRAKISARAAIGGDGNVDEDDDASTSTSSPTSSTLIHSRRRALLSTAAAVSSSALFLGGRAGTGGAAKAATSSPSSSSSSNAAAADNDAQTQTTDRIFLDVALCPSGYRQDRTLGDPSALCTDPTPLGRIVLALYGNAAPGTVAQFVALARDGELDGTLFHKVVKGSYIMAGRQGSKRMGELSPSWATLLGDSSSSQSNPDLLNPSVFDAERLPPLLRHLKPGTLSLALGANDDDETLRLRPGYRPAEFLITTGPGPVPSLDGNNIVFGRVERGLVDVVGGIVSGVKTIGETPGPFAKVAQLLGDERIERRKAKYGRPLQLVVITKAGVL